jgi:hypothetical protein
MPGFPHAAAGDVSQSPKTLFLAETFYRYGVLFLFVIMTAGRLNRH